MFKPNETFVLQSSLAMSSSCTVTSNYTYFFVLFNKLVSEPAFGWLGLGGSLGGYGSHGYTSHASLRAYGAQLGGDSSSSEDL